MTGAVLVANRSKEASMYIFHQELEAIHQDIVNDGLRRAEQRRILKEWKERQHGGRSAGYRFLSRVVRLLSSRVSSLQSSFDV
jgi:hypothetical protein